MKDVGISAVYMYFPKNAVRQIELEKFDGVSAGKYTKGLGLQDMGFCGDNEDVVSLALTAVSGLLREYEIDPNTIGFLEVGTETIIDKSKSVKSELMKLFGENKSLEGADVKHACFGGTQALFHAVDWIYSNYELEGKSAIVVMSDIAIYEKGPARPTGGAGAVALLVTPGAPIVLDRGLRAFNMEATWDFYKPVRRENSEYPVVDGSNSVNCYLRCLTGCYDEYKRKSMKICNDDTFDAVLLHCPYTKLLQKAIGRLAFEDGEYGVYSHPNYELIRGSTSLNEKEKDSLQVEASQGFWKEKTEPFLEFNRRIGNMYTPSLLAQLVHFLSKGNSHNRRLLLFAYGSGALSSMFSLTTTSNQEDLSKMEKVCSEALRRLDERTQFSPEEYTKILESRERLCQSEVPYTPTSYPVFKNTYVLTGINDKYHRSYQMSSSMDYPL